MSILEVKTDTPDGFRNKLYNIGKDGRRSMIHPTQPKGKFYNARTIVSIVLYGLLFGGPFMTWDGHPFMLFNIIERKFVLFGQVFFPQDFYLVVLAVLTALVTIFAFTSILGRIWCGWLCPQTIFLEMLFRRIEYAIDGNPVQQRKLEDMPWNATKIAKRTLKLGIFYVLSFLIANTFLAYIIGKDQLWTIITDPPSQHLVGLGIIVLFSFVFFLVFSRFREQACIIVCPYGRYQSALVDSNTILVTYDFKRGEPRGKFTKADKDAMMNAEATGTVAAKGDCIDCHQCVDVCPTGIDIRNGIQLECVNCTACIDACDTIMEKVQKPKGLIRYTSLENVRSGNHDIFTPRVKAYIGVWIVVVSMFSYFFAIRPMTEVLILRQPGFISSVDASGKVFNQYKIQVVNKRPYPVPVEVKLLSPIKGGEIRLIGKFSPIPKISEEAGMFMLFLPPQAITGTDMVVQLGVYSNGELIKTVDTKFLTNSKHLSQVLSIR